MRPVRRGQKIKKAAAWIRREKHPGSGEPAPGNDLPGQEQQSEAGSYRPPGAEGVARAAFQFFPRHDDGDAADQQNGGIEPDYGWHRCALPVNAQALAHDVGTGQRPEEPNDGRKSQLERRKVSAARYGTPRSGRSAVVIAARRGACASAVTGVYNLDIFGDCSWHKKPSLR